MRKTIFFRRLTVMAALLLTTLTAAAQEPYVVYKNQTLTFYYDNNRESRGGTALVHTLYKEKLVWNDYRSAIKTVVFDESFDACHTIKSMSYWFEDCVHLTTITGLEYLHTENVTRMDYMFSYCKELTSLDLSSFNTANVTNMNYMFWGCYNLEHLNLKNFNTSKVTSMRAMFYFCLKLTSLDLKSFDTSKVSNMMNMFGNCSALESLDISNFDTGKVSFMDGMFYGCRKLTVLDVSHFNTVNVLDMPQMFAGCQEVTTLDLSRFNTAKVRTMNGMFSSCKKLKTIYADSRIWSTANVKENDGLKLFNGCTALVGGNGTTYSEEHVDKDYACVDKSGQPGYLTQKEFTDPETYALLSDDGTTLTYYYDTKKVERKGMDLTAIEGKDKVTAVVIDDSFAAFHGFRTLAYFFYDFKRMKSITGLANLNTDNVTDMSWMFSGCGSLTSLDLSPLNTTNVTDMSRMFSGCYSLTSLDLSPLNTANVTNMSFMFGGCSSLTTLDLSPLNTDNAMDMSWMFSSCEGLTSLDLSPLNTANVTDMSGMFCFCSGLTSLDLSPLNTANVTDMSQMFCFCTGLTSLDLSPLNTDNVTNMWNLFGSCTGLTSLDLSPLNTANVTNMGQMFSHCTGLTTLDLSPLNTDNVTNMTNMFMGCSFLTRIYVGDGWSTQQITVKENGINMFTDCAVLVGGAGTTYDATYTDYTYARIDGGTASPGYLSHISQKDALPEVKIPYTTLSDDGTTLTFYYDTNMKSRGGTGVSANEFSIGDTQRSNITAVVFDESMADCTNYFTSTSGWFKGCRNLTNITGLEHLNTSSVQSMTSMFLGCEKLTVLDLSGFNTANVESIGGMFGECRSLTTIYVGDGWTTKNVKTYSGRYVFEGCEKLVGGKGTAYSDTHADYTYARIDGGTASPGYLTHINDKGMTGVKTVDIQHQTVGKRYDLGGRQVSTPRRGIVIVEGKKALAR